MQSADVIFGAHEGDDADALATFKSPFCLPSGSAAAVSSAVVVQQKTTSTSSSVDVDDFVSVRWDDQRWKRRRCITPAVSPEALADDLRARMIEDSRDPRKIECRLIEAGAAKEVGGKLFLTATETRPLLPAGPSSTDAVVLAAPTARELARAVELSNAVLFEPQTPCRPAGVGSHVCGPKCRYEPLTEKCGMRGCDAEALLIHRDLGRLTSSNEDVAPEDVWVCVESGARHLCTERTCDSLVPSMTTGYYTCSKTNKMYDRILLPDADAMFSHPVSRKTEMKALESYASLVCTGRGWRPRSAAPGADDERKRKRKKFSGPRQGPPSKRCDRVSGLTAEIVDAVMRNAAEGDAQERLAELKKSFGCADDAHRQKLGALLAAARKWAVEMAALAIVVLPSVIAKPAAPALSRDMQVMYAEKYGRFVWRLWSLVVALPNSPLVSEVEAKFRQFAMGALYQARYSFAVAFDVSRHPEFQSNRSAVCRAIRTLFSDDSISDAACAERLAKEKAIPFLSPDHYLRSRLVQENRVGVRNTVIDGILVESVAVNNGIRLVKDGLTCVAEWEKSSFLKCVADGKNPREFFGSLERRIRDVWRVQSS